MRYSNTMFRHHTNSGSSTLSFSRIYIHPVFCHHVDPVVQRYPKGSTHHHGVATEEDDLIAPMTRCHQDNVHLKLAGLRPYVYATYQFSGAPEAQRDF